MVTPIIHQAEEKQLKFFKQMIDRKKHLEQFISD
jgi:hypothetical protein